MPGALPASAVRSVRLRNFAQSEVDQRWKGARGNRAEYESKVREAAARLQPLNATNPQWQRWDVHELSLLSVRCAMSQACNYAGREDVARHVCGGAGKLLQREFGEVTTL